MTNDSRPVATDSRTLLLLALLFLAVLLLRSIYTTSPELGGDAARKYETAWLISQSWDWSELLNDRHHSARWGINVPLIGAIELLGYGPTSYMIVPLLMFAGIFTLLVAFARHSMGGLSLLVLGVLLFYEPMFFRASTNPQPFVFGLFFILVALYFLVRHIETGRFWPLVACALFAFLCYGAKESYVYFFPAIFLLLLLRKGFWSCVWLGLMLLALLGLETLVFNHVSGGELRFGRIEYLGEGRHLKSMYKKAEIFGSYPVWEFLTRRWFEIPLFDKVMTSIFTIFFAVGVVTGRIFRIETRALGIFLLAASYYAVLTFVPLSIYPLLSVQPLSGKYLTTAMPLVMFCVAFILDRGTGLLRAPGDIRARQGLAGVAALFLAFALVKESPIQYAFHAVYPIKDAFIWTQDRHIAELNQALDEGKGICVERWRMRRTVRYWLAYYMSQGLPNDTFVKSNHPSGKKILHLERYRLDQLTGYVPPPQLMKILAMPMCDIERL